MWFARTLLTILNVTTAIRIVTTGRRHVTDGYLPHIGR